MKILTRKQAIDQGYTLVIDNDDLAYKRGDRSELDFVEIMTEREEALVEALRKLNVDFIDDAERIKIVNAVLENYDA